jgi:hypothetical protein
MADKGNSGGGLSLQTLVIASLSSLAAALFIHKFWQGGAILGAAVTPVIVALVSEGLRKPVEVVTTRTGRTREQTAVNPPPVVAPREDKFGIWEEQKKARPVHFRLALATGLVAFGIAAFFLTGAELVLGGASDGDKFRVLPGKQQKKDSSSSNDSESSSTQPEEANPVPEEDGEAPPTVTVTAPPEEEVPPAEEAPEEQAPPSETAPVPDPGATTPVP